MKCYVACHGCGGHYSISSKTGTFKVRCPKCGSSTAGNVKVLSSQSAKPDWFIEPVKSKRFWEFWK